MNGIFAFDDPIFPSTRAGQRLEGLFESADSGAGKPADAPDAVEVFARQQARTQAMSAVLAWVEDGDYTYTSLDEFVCGVADLDGDFEISDEEEAVYNAVWQQVPDALQTLGADESDVNEMVNSEDNDAAARIGKALSADMDETTADDEEIIAGFALGEDAVFENASDDPEGRHMILEATYKRRKVVRDGKVQVIRKRISGKVRLSAAQKAALRKARRKANTGAAKLARRKSMRIRSRRKL